MYTSSTSSLPESKSGPYNNLILHYTNRKHPVGEARERTTLYPLEDPEL
jgi:hypothetical protein